MLMRKKEEMRKRKKRRRDVDIINDNDDLIADMIVKMKEAAEVSKDSYYSLLIGSLFIDIPYTEQFTKVVKNPIISISHILVTKVDFSSTLIS